LFLFIFFALLGRPPRKKKTTIKSQKKMRSIFFLHSRGFPGGPTKKKPTPPNKKKGKRPPGFGALPFEEAQKKKPQKNINKEKDP